MKLPQLVVSAPMRGPAGLRVAPLLAALAQARDCRFIVASVGERDLAPGPALTWSEWLDQAALEAVPHLHVLADDAAAAHALRAALHRPGLTVLQDPGLATLYQSMSLDAGQAEAWVRAQAAEHGGAGRRLARAQLAGLFTPRQRHWLPMLDALAEAAPMLGVRSRHAAGNLPPGARFVVLPEPLPQPSTPDQKAARASLGLGPGTLLLVPLRCPSPLAALRDAAAQAGATLLPCLPGDDVELHAAACDAALALALPFGATPLHPLAVALAAGRRVLAWTADPAADIASHQLDFPADEATLAAAIRGMLAAGPSSPAVAGVPAEDARLLLASGPAKDARPLLIDGPAKEARALLALLPGCRLGIPAP